MRDFVQREDDRIVEEIYVKYLDDPDRQIAVIKGGHYVSSADNLTVAEHLSFSIFQRGELAALAGLDSSECPFHEKAHIRWQEIWWRGFSYGCREVL